MDLSLREAIVQRVQNKSEQDLSDTIESSIGGDEQALPGIGVLFEMIWRQSNPTTRQQMVSSLHQHLQTKEHIHEMS